jgi:hypothetical protein
MEYAVKNLNDIKICGRRQAKRQFFSVSIDSSDINIFSTTNSELSKEPILGRIRMYSINDILCKLCIVNYYTKKGTVFIPLHHTY